MSLTAVIVLTLKFSIALGVFAVGLTATRSDATFLFRRPEKLLSALVSMYVILPAFAVIVAAAFDLPPAVKIALVALSVSPIPPILPKKALRAGGRESYAVGLLVAGSLLSIVIIPWAMELFQVIFGVPLRMTSSAVMGLVLISVLLPLIAGMAVRAVAPELAQRIVKPAETVATILLVASLVPILIAQGGQLVSIIGNGIAAALAAFGVMGLLVGHLLGGPQPGDRTVLALYSSSRHPGVAFAIAQANFPQQRGALAAIVLALLISAILALPYIKWTKRQRPAALA